MSSSTDPRPLMVEIAELLYDRNLTNSAGGNMSCRVGDRIYITPRKVGSKQRWRLRESMVLVGGILIILGMSMASTNYLIDAQIPTKIFAFIREHVDSKLAFLMLLNVFLLGLGAILDIFSALVLVVPLILPVAIGFDIHPVHLGIIFLANMQIGYFTPPVGMNLFIASFRFDKSVAQLYRATLPFFFILMAAVVIITYLPGLSLILL